MDQIVVKTEMQSNDAEILLFYVDDSEGMHNQGALTSVENIEQVHANGLQQAETYVIEDMGESADSGEEEIPTETLFYWSDDDIQRLLIFYIDNKETFHKGLTGKRHLWAIACKTMLPDKIASSCELQLQELKKKYIDVLFKKKQGVNISFAYFDLCDQAFRDDTDVEALITETVKKENLQVVSIQPVANKDGVSVKSLDDDEMTGDDIVFRMFELYKANKEHEYNGTIFDLMAVELGATAQYWRSKFNHKLQQYIEFANKRLENGDENIQWPYMVICDELFGNDHEFLQKYGLLNIPNEADNPVDRVDNDNCWNTTEKTVLAKYYFDCFQEFQDSTIPKKFLWSEVGRLLDKKPETCQSKYLELKNAHLENYLAGTYQLTTRKPLNILFDYIICKEVKLDLQLQRLEPLFKKTEEIDELVNFFYDNIELFKDSVCHFVCWVAVARKLGRNIWSCRKQWGDLVTLYMTILEDKKENPCMQIDWRYIDLFDRIFDYGMDTSLINGFNEDQGEKNAPEKVAVKKVNVNFNEENIETLDEEDGYDERGFTKRKKTNTGEQKAFAILEHYQKHKEKFSTTTQQKQQALWQVLAKQIGLSAEQCAHKFKTLKQLYTGYVENEIIKPEIPIIWPYYALCKKIFGYRALKNKLKNKNKDIEIGEEWTAKEIKQIINFVYRNFEMVNDDLLDSSKWAGLANDIGKSNNAIHEKFLELRNSFRKLKAMKIRNPEVRLSWKYYKMFDAIYSSERNDNHMEIDCQENIYQEIPVDQDKMQEDDDYQCIIVIPEGQELSDISLNNAKVTIADNIKTESPNNTSKWTKRSKRQLLTLYLNYLRRNKANEINAKHMWKEISAQMEKSPISCRKMFAKLRNNNTVSEDDNKRSPYYTLVSKILKLKPKFVKNAQNGLKKGRVYKDVELPSEKVRQALEYYLQHIEEFVSPKYEKKYVWMALANFISEPLTKGFNKINYLKQCVTKNEAITDENKALIEILNDICETEKTLKESIANNRDVHPKELGMDTFSDDEIEQLLIWYLANLEQFKDPKFSRSYLWNEASNVLKKSPLVCSKKMIEIRTQYRTMVKEKPQELSSWRFYDLCQKIYGTGKKGNENSST